MLLVLSVALVAAGLGAVTVGLLRTHALATAGPSVIDVALAPDAGDSDLDVVESAEVPPSLVYRIAEPLMVFVADLARKLSPAGRVDLLRRRLVYAGLEGTVTPERVLAAKAGAALVGAVVGFALSPGHLPALAWALIFAVFGFFAPDLWYGAKADARQKQIARALPEALDLLAITVEAGLGLEQGIQVVSDNLAGPLGDELVRLLREVELGVPRREALSALRARTDVPELSTFVVSLLQADAMGVAIGDVLKVQAEQVRLRRRQRAREQAAKTPVKILFPVIFGILPALFVVTIGPAAVSIVQNLGHLGQ